MAFLCVLVVILCCRYPLARTTRYINNTCMFICYIIITGPLVPGQGPYRLIRGGFDSVKDLYRACSLTILTDAVLGSTTTSFNVEVATLHRCVVCVPHAHWRTKHVRRIMKVRSTAWKKAAIFAEVGSQCGVRALGRKQSHALADRSGAGVHADEMQ